MFIGNERAGMTVREWLLPEPLERCLPGGVECCTDNRPAIASGTGGFYRGPQLVVGVSDGLAGSNDAPPRLPVQAGVSIGADGVEGFSFGADRLGHGRSPEIVVAAGLESVSVDDPSGNLGWHGHELEHVARARTAHHQEPFLPVVVVLDKAHSVLPSVGDVLIGDPMPAGTPPDLHTVKDTFTAPECQGKVYTGWADGPGDGQSSSRVPDSVPSLAIDAIGPRTGLNPTSGSDEDWPFGCLAVARVGVVEGGHVAQRAPDTEIEQVADPSDVAAGGVDLVEDAVLAKGLGGEVDFLPGELPADRGQPGCGAPADEQVRVDGARPGPGAVIEPRGEPGQHRAGERDVPAVEGEAAVD